MKIALVTHTFFPQSTGGREKYVYYLAKKLSEKNHKVEVFTSSDSLTKSYDEFKNSNLIVHYFPTFRFPISMGYYRINPTMLLKLLKTDVDVIHAHEYCHFTTYMSVLAARIKKLPFILTEHGYPDQIGITKNLVRLYNKIILPQIVSKSKRIIAVSNFIKKELISRYNVPSEKISVVYNSIDLEDYKIKDDTFRKKYNLENKKIILAIGRLIKEKGFQNLIKAIPIIKRKVPEAVVVIIGPNNYYKPELMRLSKTTENVIFTNTISEDMLKSAISSSDVISIPSLYEPFGIVALEAMAYEKPIVASKVGGLSEVLNESNSSLVKPGDVKELANEIINLLNNKKLSIKLGEKAKKDVKKYDWKNNIDNIINIYEDVIGY
jgi:glycosyltransferase involved in cell wall biosynthesis